MCDHSCKCFRCLNILYIFYIIVNIFDSQTFKMVQLLHTYCMFFLQRNEIWKRQRICLLNIKILEAQVHDIEILFLFFFYLIYWIHPKILN